LIATGNKEEKYQQSLTANKSIAGRGKKPNRQLGQYCSCAQTTI